MLRVDTRLIATHFVYVGRPPAAHKRSIPCRCTAHGDLTAFFATRGSSDPISSTPTRRPASSLAVSSETALQPGRGR